MIILPKFFLKLINMDNASFSALTVNTEKITLLFLDFLFNKIFSFIDSQ